MAAKKKPPELFRSPTKPFEVPPQTPRVAPQVDPVLSQSQREIHGEVQGALSATVVDDAVQIGYKKIPHLDQEKLCTEMEKFLDQLKAVVLEEKRQGVEDLRKFLVETVMEICNDAEVLRTFKVPLDSHGKAFLAQARKLLPVEVDGVQQYWNFDLKLLNELLCGLSAKGLSMIATVDGLRFCIHEEFVKKIVEIFDSMVKSYRKIAALKLKDFISLDQELEDDKAIRTISSQHKSNIFQNATDIADTEMDRRRYQDIIDSSHQYLQTTAEKIALAVQKNIKHLGNSLAGLNMIQTYFLKDIASGKVEKETEYYTQGLYFESEVEAFGLQLAAIKRILKGILASQKLAALLTLPQE